MRTKSGKELSFKYSTMVAGSRRGWRIDQITALIDNAEVGYLKMEWIPKKQFKIWYPSIFHFLKIIKGIQLFNFRFDEIIPPINKLSEYELLNLINQCISRFNLSTRLRKVDFSDLESKSKEELIKIIKKIEEYLIKLYGEEYNEFNSMLVDKPYVGFIQVEDDFKRDHIGLSLYFMGAKYLEKLGMRLHGSSLQSKEAQKAWDFMANKGLVKSTKYKYSKIRKYIDISKIEM